MKKHWRVFLLLAAVLGVYLYTLYPACAPEDSGEYTLVSALLDIPHAPGNPLYVVIGKLATMVPLGNAAYRVNMLSALFGVLTLFLAYRIMLLLCEDETVSIASALFFAFTYEFWYTTTFAKTFTALCFFLLLGLYLFMLWLRDTDRPEYFYAACFVAGLGAGIHYFVLLLAPVLALGAFRNLKRIRLRGTAVASMLFIAGLLIYLYLPLRSAAHPVNNAGRPDTFERLMRVLIRTDYFSGGAKNAPRASLATVVRESGSRVVWMARLYNDHFCTAGLALGVIGCGVLWRKKRKYAEYIFLLFALSGPGWLFISAFPVTDPFKEAMSERFLLTSELFFLFFMGMGLYGAYSLCERTKIARAARYAVFCFPLLPFSVHFQEVNHRDNYLFEDYGLNFFRTMEKDAAFFAGQHVHAAARYLQHVRQKRKDLRYTWIWSEFSPLAKALKGSSVPVYADPIYHFYATESLTGEAKGFAISFNPARGMSTWNEIRAPWELAAYRGWRRSGTYKDYYSQMVLDWRTEALVRYGEMALKLHRYEDAAAAYRECIALGVFDDDVYRIRTYNYRSVTPRSLSAYMGLLRVYKNTNDVSSFTQTAEKLISLYPRSPYLLQNISLFYFDMGKFAEAASCAEKAVALAPQDAVAISNLGVMHEKAGDPQKALECYQKALAIDPLNEMAHYNSGVVYYGLKQWGKAKEHFAKVLLANPQRDDVKKYIENIR